MDTKSIIIWAIFIAVCAAIYIVSHRIKKQTDENGIETTGVISRFADASRPDDFTTDVYVRYCTEDGEEVEGLLSNPDPNLEIGQSVRIKYHPKHKLNARMIN